MMRIKKSTMRGLVPSVLVSRRLADVRARSGQGLLPGSRLIAKEDGREIDIAVKASLERSLSFTKQSEDQWRTVGAVDLVVAVVPSLDSANVEVLAFDALSLVAMFDKAWKALERAGRALSFEIPIFIPLDEVSRKNVGHDIANLKKLAKWSSCLSPEDLKARSSVQSEEFYDRIRREIADRNGVDVSKVELEVRIKL
jgi:hypothetical protein